MIISGYIYGTMRKAEHEWLHEKEKNHLFFTIYPDVTLFLNRISGCAIFELLHDYCGCEF
jgi:hypothetical protein